MNGGRCTNNGINRKKYKTGTQSSHTGTAAEKEHKISLMKVGISFLIVIALVLGSVSVVTVIKNREIHLSNLYDKSNAVFGIEKFSSMPTERLLFLKICVYQMEQKTILP